MHPMTSLYGKMERACVRLEAEIAAEQVSHPVDQYQPGSERLERLYAQMADAQRFRSPDVLEFNL